MRKYQPSGLSAPGGLLMLFGGGALLACVVGIAMGLVAVNYSLIIIMPLAASGIAALIASNIIGWKKVRNPRLALLCGLMIGVLSYGAMTYTEYRSFRASAIQSIITKGIPALDAVPGSLNSKQAGKVFDSILKSRTGLSDFPGYLLMVAEEGVSINSSSTSEGANLGQTGTWILWGIELLLCAAYGAFQMYRAVDRYFCETCDQWYPNEQPVAFVQTQNGAALQNMLERGSYHEAAQLLDPPAIRALGGLELFAQQCPNCPHADVVIRLMKVSQNSKGQIVRKQVIAGLVTPDDYSTLLEPKPSESQI